MKGRYFDAHQKGLDEFGQPVYDRVYQASDHAAERRPFFSERGVFSYIDSEACKVVVEGSSPFFELCVKPGYLYIKGYQGECEGTAEDERFSTAALPDGNYRYIISLNLNEAVRAFVPELRRGGIEYPEIIRLGNIYDVCLANVQIESGVPKVIEDTRYDTELCGQLTFAYGTPLPAYYPPTVLPEILWLYTIFPDALTLEQIELVESNPHLLESFKESRINKLTPMIVIPFDKNIPVSERLPNTLYMQITDLPTGVDGSVMFVSPNLTGRIIE
jgi:hypothetical protein